MQDHRVIVNVEVAVVRDGQYLATVRGGGEEYGAGWLGFPGGKANPASAMSNVLEETACREVREEAGLDLDGPIVYVESHTFAIGDEIVLDVVMLARSTTDDPYLAAPDEVAGIEWLPFEAFRDDPRTQPWTRDSLVLVELRRLELGW
ncbi:MAG: NUDIX hydrolase [Chloroflexia bacterium]|nr:NUDIX hydrolase [Chloroflexia bacterium]